MLRSPSPSLLRKALSTSGVSRGIKVGVLGAAGGIGQPTSLLCKISPLIDEVELYDVVGTPGVAADISHCPTRAKVTGDLPAPGTWPPGENAGLKRTLEGCDVVIIPAGVPRKVRNEEDNRNKAKRAKAKRAKATRARHAYSSREQRCTRCTRCA